MKKWNCNIVKEMYDRVIHRKYGLLCSDDTSNESFLESYRNRLDCEYVDLHCYGNNEPCPSTTITDCNLDVNITYAIQDINYCPVDIDPKDFNIDLGVVYSLTPSVGWRLAANITSTLSSITSHPNYTGGINVVNYKVVDSLGNLVGGYLPSEAPGSLQTIVGNALTVYRVDPIWPEVYFIAEIEADFDFGYGDHTIRFTFNQTVLQPIINSGTIIYNIPGECLDLDVTSVYVFTANVTGAVNPTNYVWNYDPLKWSFVNELNNTITLIPLVSVLTVTYISVAVTDSRGCQGSNYIKDLTYLGGCTDPNAINYNPDATFNNGSCYYEPLTLVTGYVCNRFKDGDFCATVSGGVPPYTLIGFPSSTIPTNGGSYCETILNGNSWSCYALDSVGNVTSVQLGTVSCPFDCESISIIPNVTITCLEDNLGNATGQGQVYCTPFGGTAPYTITISVNSAPAIPFVNGSIYNHNDLIKIYIDDANGCKGYFEEQISCPPATPGGSFDSCSSLAEYLNGNDSVAIQVSILDAGLNFGGGYYVDYQVKWITTIPSPLTSANFPVVVATITNNTTTNLSLQTAILPYTGSGNPYTYIGNVVLNNQVNIQANYSTAISCGGGLLREFVPPVSPNLNLTVDLDFTVVLPNGLTCHLCGTGLFSLDYDPCDDPFVTSDQTVLITLTQCL